jgi:hypothetical protein
MPLGTKQKGKGKRKGKRAAKTVRKKVRFKFEKNKPEEEKEVEEKALPVLKRSKRVGRLLKKVRGSKTTL